VGPTVGDPQFRAIFNGVPGASYTVEGATNVTGRRDWKTNVIAPGEDEGLGIGVFEFDNFPATNARSFFRVFNPAYTP
jgi:hypothetical protein